MEGGVWMVFWECAAMSAMINNQPRVESGIGKLSGMRWKVTRKLAAPTRGFSRAYS